MSSLLQKQLRYICRKLFFLRIFEEKGEEKSHQIEKIFEKI